MLTLSNAASHNAFYIEKDITSWYNDSSLWDRIAGTNGYDEFEGIFPGCYFDMSQNVHAPGKLGSKKVLIAGLNYMWHNGDTYSSPASEPTYNHIVCCPYTDFGDVAINQTDTSTGGYYNSNLNLNIIGLPTTTGNSSGTINEQLYAEFGNHLKITRELITTAVNDQGISSNWSWNNTQAILFSETEVLGFAVFGNYRDIGCSINQYPIFIYNKKAQSYQPDTLSKLSFWLRSVASTSKFVHFASDCRIDGRNSSQIARLKPRFILA